MKKFIFIHGSASGQSELPLGTESSQLCSEISEWYFKGRANRVIGTSVPFPMFVELYIGMDGKRYCLYSFVLNECHGPADYRDGHYRDGQYFAVTIALQDYYCLRPSSIYSLLKGAYDHFIRNKIIDDKVAVNGKEYLNVYKISQFKEKEKELVVFQKNISDLFDKNCQQFCKELPKKTSLPMPWNGTKIVKMVNGKAEALPWNGETIHLEECDSGASGDKLFRDGRIYISDEAPRLSAVVEELQSKNNNLQRQNENLQRQNEGLQYQVDHPKQNPKDKQKIETLTGKVDTLEQKVNDAKTLNEQLKRENDDLVGTLNGISGLLAKQKENIDKQIGNINNEISQKASNSNGWKRWIKEILLIVVLLLTMVCLVLNVCFFRSGPSNFDKINSQIDSICVKVDVLDNYVRSLNQAGEYRAITGISTENSEGETPDYGLTVSDSIGNL